MSDTPRTDALTTALYHEACADAAAGMVPGIYATERSPEECYGMAVDLAKTLERELSAAARKLERCSEQFDASERALEATTRKLAEAERENRAHVDHIAMLDEEETKLDAQVAQLQQQLAETNARLDDSEQIFSQACTRIAEQDSEIVAALEQRNQHIKREQALEQQLVEARKDAARYRWLLPIVTGSDEADNRTAAVAAALIRGLDGDAAIDVAIEASR